uniref:Restriction endonuclease type IV Mrr domain-containing protein n=1 Tax=Candidatus Methanomethylicus mesodigestus TaxID=1867258 RepID=A0A7C3J3X4_9CREN
MSLATQIIEIIFRTLAINSWCFLSVAIEDAMKKIYPQEDEISISQKSEDIRSEVVREILHYCSEMKAKGIDPKFFLSTDKNEIIGRSYVFDSDSDKIKLKKKNLENFESILKVLEENEHDVFHRVCCCFLLDMGNYVEETRLSKDKGVDILIKTRICNMIFQVKHWKKPPQMEDIKAWVGKVKTFGPKPGAALGFISLRTASPYTIRESKTLGITLYDGERLAYHLCSVIETPTSRDINKWMIKTCKKCKANHCDIKNRGLKLYLLK